VFEQVISSAKRSYPGPDLLSFGHLHALFTQLPVTFTAGNHGPDIELFGKIAKTMRRAKVDLKLSDLGHWRNGVGHQKDYVTSLSISHLRQKSSTVLTGARAALAELDRQRFLPVTVLPEEERRDRYGRRVLRLRDTDNAPIEVYVSRETDFTEPLIYFASDNSRRDIDPRFVQASVVEALSGLTGKGSRPGRA
jgi:hypothetical protein